MSNIPQNMQNAIITSSVWAGAVGIPGAFAIHWDTGILVGIWGGLLINLALKAGKNMEKETAGKVVAGVLIGVGGFAGGIKLATTYFALTGIGTVPAVIANVGANATVTYLFGRAAARTFLSSTDGDSAEAIIRSILNLFAGGPSDDN